MKNNNINNKILQENKQNIPSQMQNCGTMLKTRCCCFLATYNWLKDFTYPEMQTPLNVAEVRFKYNHKDFYTYDLSLNIVEGDVVAVEAEQGHDVGTVTLLGEAVRFQMNRKEIRNPSELKKIYRKAKIQDIERWIQSAERENIVMKQTKQIIRDLRIDMKLNDLEFRGDGVKAIFYYTASKRIDFRELIKILADKFHIKIEMKQIGIRQESAKVGGLGSCGRELCCATWIPTFQSVSTQSARTQQLPINPQKLAGQCGKLKCCLNYEQDTYMDSLRFFPSTNISLKTKQGKASFMKADVFKKMLYYSYNNNEEKFQQIIELPLNTVWKIIKLNEQHQYPERLEDFIFEAEEEKKVGFTQLNQDDVTRFDAHNKKNNKKKDKKSKPILALKENE